MAGRRFSTSRAGKVEDGQGHRRVHAKRQLCPGVESSGAIGRRSSRSSTLLAFCRRINYEAQVSQTRYRAAVTDFTVMVLSLSVPVTVAFAPACLSKVARASLSLVSSV